MRPAAYQGIGGDIVRLLAPSSEADPAAILMTLLASAGIAIGPGPHMVAGGVHPARLNVILVGRSARARKGTSWSAVREVLAHGCPDFVSSRVIGGVSSGEGLVSELKKRPEGIQRSVLVLEQEWARTIRAAAQSASLSSILRQCWDGENLSVLTRKDPLTATGVNVALVGHITIEELRRRLDGVELANGFANRMLWIFVERARRLASPPRVPREDLEVLGARLRQRITSARDIGEVGWSAEAAIRWEDFYNNAIPDDLDGVVGSLMARGEPHVLRLALTFALLDGSDEIDIDHLDAAIAIWEHVQRTIWLVFGEDRKPDWIAPRLLAALREAGDHGLDGTAQHDLFHRRISAERLAQARAELESRGLARTVVIETGGRPRIVTRVPVAATAPIGGPDLYSYSSVDEGGFDLGMFDPACKARTEPLWTDRP